MDRARIQIQDITGNWITVSTVINQDQIIYQHLDSVQRSYKKTVRAIDKNGSILQLRPWF